MRSTVCPKFLPRLSPNRLCLFLAGKSVFGRFFNNAIKLLLCANTIENIAINNTQKCQNNYNKMHHFNENGSRLVDLTVTASEA